MTGGIIEPGWFADIDAKDDPEATPEHPWRPYLQLDGMCLPLAIRFASKEDCDRFITEDILANNRTI